MRRVIPGGCVKVDALRDRILSQGGAGRQFGGHKVKKSSNFDDTERGCVGLKRWRKTYVTVLDLTYGQAQSERVWAEITSL